MRKYRALALSTRYSLFSTGSCRYVSSSKSSLFSLSSINGYPSVKVIIKSSHYSNAIQYTRSSLGPSFGNGHNLHVYDNNAAGNRSSYTYCVPPNPSPLGFLHLVLSVDFMQDPANSLPLMWETHLQFCKRYLEVNNKASNIACRAELGRFPLNITINKKISQIHLYIQSKDEESFVKKSFSISLDLHYNCKNSLHSHLMNMSEHFNLPDFNPDLLDTATVKSSVSSMKREYISYWQRNSQKLEFFRSFKTDHTTSNVPLIT